MLSLQETQDAAQSNWGTKNNRRREEKKSLHIASVDVDGLVHARRKQETETGTLWHSIKQCIDERAVHLPPVNENSPIEIDDKGIFR